LIEPFCEAKSLTIGSPFIQEMFQLESRWRIPSMGVSDGARDLAITRTHSGLGA